MKWNSKYNLLMIGMIIIVLNLVPVLCAAAGFFSRGEISLTGYYSKRNFGDRSYQTIKRYTAAFGVNITPITLIQASYTDSRTYMDEDPYQTIDTKEQTLAVTFLQLLVPASFLFQPYVKIGGAQYNRYQTGTVFGVPSREVSSKSPSGVLGAGLRVFFFRGFSLKIEGIAYLPDAKISEAKNNTAVEGGLAWSF